MTPESTQWVRLEPKAAHATQHTLYARAPMLVRPAIQAQLGKLYDASTGTAYVYDGCAECQANRAAKTPFVPTAFRALAQ